MCLLGIFMGELTLRWGEGGGLGVSRDRIFIYKMLIFFFEKFY